jgi:hypothetical protein
MPRWAFSVFLHLKLVLVSQTWGIRWNILVKDDLDSFIRRATEQQISVDGKRPNGALDINNRLFT